MYLVSLCIVWVTVAHSAKSQKSNRKTTLQKLRLLPSELEVVNICVYFRRFSSPSPLHVLWNQFEKKSSSFFLAKHAIISLKEQFAKALRPSYPLGHHPCPFCDGYNAAVEGDAFDPCLQRIHLCLHLVV